MMKKIKSFKVNNLSPMTREEMVMINGGDFSIVDCREGMEYAYCAYAFVGHTVEIGICKYKLSTHAGGSIKISIVQSGNSLMYQTDY